jgi:copper transport protein
VSRAAPRVAALALGLIASAAWPHASLVDTHPADGARLEAPPAEVVLRFDEPVTPIAVRLLDASGAPLTLPAPPAAHDNQIRVAVPPGLPPGPYLLSYRVTSLDSHPVGGSVAFAVGTDAPAAASGATGPADSGPGWPRVALRALHYLALFTAAGGALFLLLVAPFPGQRPILVGAAAIAALTAIAGTGLQGAALMDAPVLGLDAWRAGLASSRGRSAVVLVAGALAIAGGATVRRQPLGRGLLAAGAIVSMGSLLLTGHVATARPPVFAGAALAAHVFAAAFWAGSLVALWAMLRGSTAVQALPALRRFSRIAIVAVPMLALGALGFATIQLGALADLRTTPYGGLILLKALFLAALVGLAALNRVRLVPALARGDGRAAGRLRGSIGGELVLVACVAGVTAVLSQTPPPRTAATTVVRTLHAGERSLELSVAPARAGRNTIGVRFTEIDGGRPEPAEVTLEIANPAAGVEPIVRRAERLAPGDYRYEGGELAFPGAWTVEIHARVGDFDRLVFRAELAIR